MMEELVGTMFRWDQGTKMMDRKGHEDGEEWRKVKTGNYSGRRDGIKRILTDNRILLWPPLSSPFSNIHESDMAFSMYHRQDKGERKSH